VSQVQVNVSYIIVPFCSCLKLLYHMAAHLQGTPEMAKKILAHSINRPALDWIERTDYIVNGVARISYDPDVLVQDGWTLKKSSSPQGASGGAFLIGRKIIWEKYDAVIIAFVHDDELGDLWKAMWIADQDTFDLEADEMWDALKKWENKQAKKRIRTANASTKGDGEKAKEKQASRGHLRYKTFADFSVDGVEHGIVLAASSNSNARKGVMWPARVMHVSELDRGSSSAKECSNSNNRRGAAKRNLAVIFLAPYWNGQQLKKVKGSYTDVPTSVYSTGPLFEVETVEPTTQIIKKYPYDDNTDTLSIDKVRTEFKFLGLPKAAFPRYLDAHRVAAALQRFGKGILTKDAAENSHLFGALTDCHQMAIKTTQYPTALLELPYDFILKQLPHPSEQVSQMSADEADELTEPVLHLSGMLQAMKPPNCFGTPESGGGSGGPNNHTRMMRMDSSSLMACPPTPQARPQPAVLESPAVQTPAGLTVSNFASEYLLSAVSGTGRSNKEGGEDGATAAATAITLAGSASRFTFLGHHLSSLVVALNDETRDQAAKPAIKKRTRLATFLNECLSTKVSYIQRVFICLIEAGAWRQFDHLF
jgi:hypothetical protein